MKMNSSLSIDPKCYFWRTSQQQEIDYIEELYGNLNVYEFTFNEKKKKQISKTFINAYNVQNISIVNKENYGKFLGIGND
jgi:hypothetical protein